MRQANRLPPPRRRDNVTARPSAADRLARDQSRSLIFLALVGGALAAFLVLKAGVPFVSSVLQGGRPGQSPAAPAQATAPAIPQEKSATKGATSEEQRAIRADPRAGIEARTALAARPAEAGDGISLQLRQALEGEREQVAALARELAAARREIEKRGALVTAVSSEMSEIRQAAGATALYLQQALEEERKRVTSLTQELATARRELELHTARATTAAEAAATPAQEIPERERQAADVPADNPPPAGHEVETTTAAVNAPATPHVEPDATPPHPAKDPGTIDSPVLATAEGDVEAKKLLARADLLLRLGDISAARVVLERAVGAGSAEAGYRLAETYDPRVLSSWGTLGTRGDAAKARELYARAYAGGIEQAKDRMNALQ